MRTRDRCPSKQGGSTQSLEHSKIIAVRNWSLWDALLSLFLLFVVSTRHGQRAMYMETHALICRYLIAPVLTPSFSSRPRVPCMNAQSNIDPELLGFEIVIRRVVGLLLVLFLSILLLPLIPSRHSDVDCGKTTRQRRQQRQHRQPILPSAMRCLHAPELPEMFLDAPRYSATLVGVFV